MLHIQRKRDGDIQMEDKRCVAKCRPTSQGYTAFRGPSVAYPELTEG